MRLATTESSTLLSIRRLEHKISGKKKTFLGFWKTTRNRRHDISELRATLFGQAATSKWREKVESSAIFCMKQLWEMTAI